MLGVELSKVRDVCSSWIFNVYVNDLILDLESSGLGCYFKVVFAWYILYPDDVILMSSSITKLQRILDFRDKYASDHEFTFNYRYIIIIIIAISVYKQCYNWTVFDYVSNNA
jgi:hypothetical protein